MASAGKSGVFKTSGETAKTNDKEARVG